LRVTGANADRQALAAELAQEGVSVLPGRFSRFALLVKSGNVLSSQAWREGRVVIQDEASQLVAELVAPQAGQRVLDLCAAPGMKAGQLAQMLGEGTLVACDASAPRLRTMARLLPRWVPAAVRLSMIRIDAARELPFEVKSDRILLDAPCSGTGTLARNPEIKWRLEPRDLARHAETLRGCYSTAYGWTAPAPSIAARRSNLTLRHHVRSWITEWDMLRLQGSSSGVEVSPVAPDYTENPDTTGVPPDGDAAN